MGQVVVYSTRGADSYAAGGSGTGGGEVDDILRRLGNVETCVMDLKTQVAFIAANMPHLATAKSVADLRTEMAGLRTELKGDIFDLRTELKEDISDLKTELKGDISDLRTELKGDISDLRKELTASVSEVKSELTASISGVKSELTASISGVKSELTASISGVKSELTASISGVKSELTASISGVKSELSEVKSEVSRIGGIIPHLATAASVSALEARIIKWFVGTAIALTAMAFSIAKFVH
jgi:gas vesicle protein